MLMLEHHMTLEQIHERLAERGASPQDKGTVEMIVRRPDMGEREVLDSAELDLTEGMVGDNWRTRGSSRTEDGSANPLAQITLMNSRTIDAIAGDRIRWSLAGDQLFVDIDLSDENLPAGQRIAIGTAVLEITELPHTGCGKFTERFGSGATRLVNSPEGRASRQRGVNARVIQPGTISVGDVVTKIAKLEAI